MLNLKGAEVNLTSTGHLTIRYGGYVCIVKTTASDAAILELIYEQFLEHERAVQLKLVASA